jgi:hypothetical protein
MHACWFLEKTMNDFYIYAMAYCSCSKHFFKDFFIFVFDVKYYLEVNPGRMGEAEVEHHKTPQEQNNLNNNNCFGKQHTSFENKQETG